MKLEMPDLSKVSVKRESLLLPVNGKDSYWDYLTVYGENEKVLARTEHAHPEGPLSLDYEGLNLYSRSRGDNLSVTLKSLQEACLKQHLADEHKM